MENEIKNTFGFECYDCEGTGTYQHHSQYCSSAGSTLDNCDCTPSKEHYICETCGGIGRLYRLSDIEQIIANNISYITLKQDEEESRKLASLKIKKAREERISNNKKESEDRDKRELQRLNEKYGKV